MTVTFRINASKSFASIANCLRRKGNRWMSYREIAEATGLSLHTVYNCLNSGRFRYFERVYKDGQYTRHFFRLSAMGLEHSSKTMPKA